MTELSNATINRAANHPGRLAASPGSAHRLPIEHPEYRYPPCQNPYWAKNQALYGRVFMDNQCEEFAGRWRDQFGQTTLPGQPSPSRPELHVEIGCNAGHVIGEWAGRHPDRLFIGIDWKFKPIHRAAEKSIKQNKDNIRYLRAHAERLPFMFGPAEIDALFLYFPDPWPKKSHWRNRFLTAERLAAIAPLVKTGGIFHIKTDHPGYFEWMEEAIRAVPHLWRVKDRSNDLHRGHPNPTQLQIPDVTLFEKLFIKDGIPIHSVHLERI